MAKIELSKIRQLPHVQHVVLRLRVARLGVLRGRGDICKAVVGGRFSSLHLGPAEQHVRSEGLHFEFVVLHIPAEVQLCLTLRVARLAGEAAAVGVEEEFEVKDDVSEVAQLRGRSARCRKEK